jgi:hypothetical protein
VELLPGDPAGPCAVKPNNNLVPYSLKDLAHWVRRAQEAAVPVAVVELLGPGARLAPSRGGAGTRYPAEEISVRELSPWGTGLLASGIFLYPPPDETTTRIIVLPMEKGNWLRYDDDLEAEVTEIIGQLAGS